MKMICDIPVYYEEYGKGKVVLNIHGWGPDSRMMKGCLEPIFSEINGYRRIYVDLPGFGKTPTTPAIKSADDMLDILCEFIDTVIGKENFLLTGCSYGGYLSLGLLHRMNERIDGALLLVPMVESRKESKNSKKFEHKLLWKSEQLDLLEESPSLNTYLNMAVIATLDGYEKWNNYVQPGLELAINHESSVSKYSTKLEEAIKTMTFDKPACILAGRQDGSSVCHHTKVNELIPRFPRATFAVLDGAGHILHIDNEPLFGQLVKDWIYRVQLCN